MLENDKIILPSKNEAQASSIAKGTEMREVDEG